MSDQGDIQSAEAHAGGTEAPAEATSSSVVAKIVRISLYGMMLLAATTLVAVSAVPELSNYVPLIPDAKRPEPDPEMVARLMAQQQAYLRSACIHDDGISANSVTEGTALEESSAAESVGEDATAPADEPSPETQPADTATDSASRPETPVPAAE